MKSMRTRGSRTRWSITYSNLHANIQDCFYAAGVEIMSPVYSALRDGNKTAIPAEFLPKDYRPQGFRIAKADDGRGWRERRVA